MLTSRFVAWLQVNIESKHETLMPTPWPPGATGPKAAVDIHANNIIRKFRWRGRLLRAMVASKLYSRPAHHVDRNFVPSSIQIHNAIDCILRASSIARSAPRGSHLQWMPLSPARIPLLRHLSHDWKPRMDVDPQRFDQLIDVVWHDVRHVSKAFTEVDIAQLHLVHPRK